jgi:hypothetical protein
VLKDWAAVVLATAIELFACTTVVLRDCEAEVLCVTREVLRLAIVVDDPVLRDVMLEASLVLSEAIELFD